MKFYKESWFIIAMLLVFFPLGLYLMWRYTRWSKFSKIIITILIAIEILLAVNAENEPNKINTQPIQQKTEQQVTPSTEPTEEPTTMTEGQIINYLNEYLQATDTDGYWGMIEENNAVMFIYYPGEGVAQELREMYINPNDKDLKTAAEVMKKGFSSLSEAVAQRTDKVCMLGIANPENEQNVLYTFMNGKCTYDAYEALRRSNNMLG